MRRALLAVALVSACGGGQPEQDGRPVETETGEESSQQTEVEPPFVCGAGCALSALSGSAADGHATLARGAVGEESRCEGHYLWWRPRPQHPGQPLGAVSEEREVEVAGFAGELVRTEPAWIAFVRDDDFAVKIQFEEACDVADAESLLGALEPAG